ncbi:MAG: ATP-dependent helicase HrpB [Rhodospirillales bacterium]|nr:ATP-dependent helicase HrpB [Rhodospirillales bacterium]
MTSAPPPEPELPVLASLPALRAALAAGRNAVLIAPPGAGKTTLVPPALLDESWLGGQRIVMLEPRRLATRAAAARMAALRGEQVGQVIGYRTRLDSAVSAATRVEVVTEGLLVRRLLGDPGLDGVGLVILDEVHERGLDADMALAFCRHLQVTLRPELRLLAMSATADGARLARLLDGEIIESAGRAHPVEIRHAARDLAGLRDLPEAMARAVRAALAEPGEAGKPGDILAFLPGMGEIRRTEAALAGCGALVLPLHGELPPAAQDLALRPAAGRRVVLATSIAETSLTVPGVRIVVDGGWRRAPRLDAASGLTRLATLRISRAAAAQRAGRAGREAPGVAIRLWTPATQRGLAEFDRPEILEADLAGLALDCAAWGEAPTDLPFPDPPPAGPLAAAVALLVELGAMAEGGGMTDLGRRMAGLGAHPRLAAMMLAAATPGERALAADLAAILEERDPLRGTELACDIALRLDALDGRGEADRAALARIRRGAGQYRRRLGAGAIAHEGEAGMLLAAGFPDRIAQRRGEPGSFRLAGGGGAKLPLADPLSRAGLLAVASLEMKAGATNNGARIRLAAPLDPRRLPASLVARLRETTERGFDPVTGTVLVRRRRRLGALVLEDRTEPAPPEEAAGALAAALPLDALGWGEEARQLQARAAWMRRVEPEGGWPDLSDAALDADRAWLEAALFGCTRREEAARLDVAGLLRARLGHGLASRLEREVPGAVALPGGRARIDYAQDVPLAEARAQAFYGLATTPLLAGGRVPLRLALLSPAGRPIAITADLAGFWGGGWADARRDMRGRYPKHHWPEDPVREAVRPR